MADDATANPEPEISGPSPAPPPRPPRPDPGVIEGEATEIRDAAEGSAPAPEPEAPEAASPAPGWSWPHLDIVPLAAIAAALGALIGAILALAAAWLLDPRAAALDQSRVRLSALEQGARAQAGDLTTLDHRIAALEAGAKGDAKADALDGLAGRVGALESADASAAAKSAQDEARAASAAAAKALDLASRPPPAPPAAASDAGADTSALAPRLDDLDQRLVKLEGASTAAKTEARVAQDNAMNAGATDAASAEALLALSLDQRFSAGAPFAEELATLAKRGVGADKLAPLQVFAGAGAPTAAAIAARWSETEPKLAAALAPPPASGWDRLFDHMRALVRVRRVDGTVGGEDSDSQLAAVGAALARGDEAGALAAFAKLPDAARAAGADWAKAAAARDAAAEAAAGLRAEALGKLAAEKN
ncbi:MAG: hypothetical protein E7774_08365 [Bradyrhizobium sp.]|nr:MAG: hypothetical protein E7774_08365 [Bradyrhizobium sp.]